MPAPDLSVIRYLKSRGKFEDARDQLNQWLQGEPDNPYLEWEMGSVLDELDQIPEAVRFYQRALRHEPASTLALQVKMRLGNDLRVLGRVSESRQVLEDARGEFPVEAALDLFYALTLWADQDYAQSFRLVWKIASAALESNEADTYRAMLRYYGEHLNDRPRF